MALKGNGSFTVDWGSLDRLTDSIKDERRRSVNLIKGRVTQGTNIMWRIARQKRPMLSKAQMKKEGRKKRVSDPNAELGVPVQTGALQGSIQKTVTVYGDTVVGRIWTSLSYAKFVEFGTSKMAARPFMRPAISLTRDAIKKLFEAKVETNA